MTIPHMVVAYIEAMQSESGSITLHIHEGKVTRIETKKSINTATVPLYPT